MNQKTMKIKMKSTKRNSNLALALDRVGLVLVVYLTLSLPTTLLVSGFQSLAPCSSFVRPLPSLSSFPSHERSQQQQQRQLHDRQRQRQRQRKHSFVTSIHMSSTSSSTTTTTTSSTPTIKLYNSLTNSKEPLTTILPNKVSMYTCGPTVYDYAHVGNFRAFLTYDILKRTLSYFHYDVDHICNLTDVDDKIIQKCLSQNKSLLEITRLYEQLFMDDLQALNIIPARMYPRATEHIPEMVEMIQDLEKVGLAYQSEEGSWYFNVAGKEGYGQQLVKLDVDNMKRNASGLAGKQRQKGAKSNDDTVDDAADDTTDDTADESDESEEDTNMDADEYDADKVGARDFALWKAYKPAFDIDDATWDTPIGRGRPGWHLECSAMAKKYLGESIDVHCGGIDLKFPHHENEIAQSEGANGGKKFCAYWVHNGFVNIGDEKMSKSKGNFLTLRGACPTSTEVRAYRYLIVSSQYRNPLSFTEQAMGAAKGALSRLDNVMILLDETLDNDNNDAIDSDDDSTDRVDDIVATVTEELTKFEAALADDINMPRASASLFGVIKAAEKEYKRLKKEERAVEKGTGREFERLQNKATEKGNGATVTDMITPLDRKGLQAARDAIHQMDQVFGLLYTVPPAKNEDGSLVEGQSDDNSEGGEMEIPDDVLDLVRSRSAAKDAKDWELADSLRSRVTELGFAIKDVKGEDPIVSRL